MADQNGDTPLDEKDQKPAGGQSDTPPANGTPPDPIEELKNQVKREEARATTALQGQATAEKKARDERILRINAEKKLKALSGAGGEEGKDKPAAPGTVNADDSEAEMERLNAEKGIANLIMLTPDYQALLQKDPTLKEVLVNNPLSLISEYIDAEDAVDQIKKKLDSRISAGGAPAPKDGAPAPKDVPAPSGDSVEMKGSVTPTAASKMSPQEWAKLPKAERQKMLSGEF